MKTLLVFSHLRWNFVFLGRAPLSAWAPHYACSSSRSPSMTPVRRSSSRSMQRRNLGPASPHSLTSAVFERSARADCALVAEHLSSQGDRRLCRLVLLPKALPLLDHLASNRRLRLHGRALGIRRRTADCGRGSTAPGTTDLVLTGGPSLYEAKRTANPRVLCLPSSVDAKHFAVESRSDDAAMVQRAHELQGGIGAPRLGYFGVIDERMDLDLVARVADARSDWNVVMVGPIVKIDPQSVPRRANLHWLGQQPYELLPRLIEGWSVGLLPFALNESTRFISPTKTLEYMAPAAVVNRIGRGHPVRRGGAGGPRSGRLRLGLR